MIIRCICIFCLWSAVLQAQDNPSSLSDRYARGRSLFLQGDYQAAIDVLRPLSRRDQGNPYVEYASFYFGLSALKSGNYELAKNMFLQVESKFPKWNNVMEVNYWLANTYFELGEYESALNLLEKLNANEQLSEDAVMMKNYYLDQADTEVLRQLLTQYPDDKEIASQLVKDVASTRYGAEEQAIIDSLVAAFDIDMSSLGVASREASVKKQAYNVAVMLPFLYESLNPSSRRQGNQFVVDLYKGIKMAASDLRKGGINVQLHAYDTERSYEKTQGMLEQDEMTAMDVFIGPLYPGPYRAATAFALEQRKYMFNPLSSNPAAIGENPFAYLMKPSLITEARAAAKFALDSLNPSKAVIITGTSTQDSLRVASFLSEFRGDTAREVLLLEEENFNRERIEELVDTLNYMGEDNMVYVASNNKLLISNTISSVVMAEHKVPVIGSEEWLNISSITYDQLEGFDEYLTAPSFIDPENKNLEDFKERYRRVFYEIPNRYTFVGYDLMMYIGYMLDRYGIYFQKFHTQQEAVNSLLYAGYDYFNANDNQIVPIIKYEDAQLRLVDVRP